MYKRITVEVDGRWYTYPIKFKKYSTRLFRYNSNNPLKLFVYRINDFLKNN